MSYINHKNNGDKTCIHDIYTYKFDYSCWEFCKKCIYYKIMQLPLTLQNIKRWLDNRDIKLNDSFSDGRTNSTIDEDSIIKILEPYLKEHNIDYWIPPPRHWFDLTVKDPEFGWLPINIKSTRTTNPDNIGNMAICVQAYTQIDLMENMTKSRKNGDMQNILDEELINNRWNNSHMKDYYFLVINKNTNEIIINSILGLKKLNTNSHNLPFQIKWKDNKTYYFMNMQTSINKYLEVLKKYSETITWKDKHRALYSKLKLN